MKTYYKPKEVMVYDTEIVWLSSRDNRLLVAVVDEVEGVASLHYIDHRTITLHYAGHSSLYCLAVKDIKHFCDEVPEAEALAALL